MCGFAGLFDARRDSTADTLQAAITRMTATLEHRGPDDEGHFVDASRGVALGHRRLSIVDLSPTGKQPMSSRTGRFQLAYNGEIYNHAALRDELAAQGEQFRGTSDTEVLLAAVEKWGIAAAVQRCNGMFAFALWDAERREIHLLRDRLGIKPLYYAWVGGAFLFASELKALRSFPGFSAEIDRSALSSFLHHNYVPAPASIYRAARKLPPASWLTVTADSVEFEPQPQTYWSFADVAESGRSSTFEGTDEEGIERLEEVLTRAVSSRMRADVPLGAFLSGGIDSTAVVALMQSQSTTPVKTFCIGFEDAEYDESGYAQRVADHLHTDHLTLRVTGDEARAVVPKLPGMYDEPFGDSSQIPTYLVSELARSQVTVSLSGDGGDELFGGYQRYATAAAIWQKIGGLPTPVRGLAERLIDGGGRLLPLPSKLRTLARFLTASCPSELYSRFHIHWKRPQEVVVGGQDPQSLFASRPHGLGWEPVEAMMYIDTTTYLPDDILVKLDRASMAVGLEARVPLLDHEVVEFAWTLPMRLRRRGDESKWLLREVVDRYVPRPLMDRRKVGFGVPLDAWLRGPLRDWAEALLDEQRLRSEGYLRPEPIRTKWQEHLSGQRQWHYYLWDVLMFQAWLESEGA